MTGRVDRAEQAIERDEDNRRARPENPPPWGSLVRMQGLSGGVLRRIKPLRATVRGVRALHRRLRLQVWQLEGRERTSGEPLTVLFQGQLENKNYLKRLIYAGHCRETSRRVWCWRLEKLIYSTSASHALAIVQRTELPQTIRRGTFYIPCWIGGEIDLAAAARGRHVSDNVKADLRRIKKHRLDYTIERSHEAILRFYDEMYRPYIHASYGGCAYLEPRADLEAKLERAELMLVRQDGQPIAGQVMLYEPTGVRGWLLGVKDGDRRYVRDGAIAALYHFTVIHLSKAGFAYLDCGESRAFLSDGVLRFKAVRGMRLRSWAPKWFSLSLRRYSRALHAFLTHNPFLYEADGRLYGAIFAEREQQDAKQLDRWQIEGMAGFLEFRAVASDAGDSGWNAAAFRPGARAQTHFISHPDS